MSWSVRLLVFLFALCLTLPALALVPLRERPFADDRLTAKVVENSLGMKLIRIEPGTFMMGSPAAEPERYPCEIHHEVAITKPFYIGKFEVTQDEYEKIMGANPAAFNGNGANKDKVAGLDTRRFPIEFVTWHEAREFCTKLTTKDLNAGKIKAGMAYSLPTEAEWEYCCRAGTTTAFHFGPALSAEQANFGNDKNRTVAVGSYPPNAWGLHDMHGNVWEYCEDGYIEDGYSKTARLDPLNKNLDKGRVLRGGGWGINAGLCRSALRGYNGEDTRYDYNGFRVVLRLE